MPFLKRATVVGLSIATVLGLASIVSAAPYGVKDLKDKSDSDKHSSIDSDTRGRSFAAPFVPFDGKNLYNNPYVVGAIGTRVAATAKQNAQDEVAGIGIASLKIQSTHSVPVSGSTIIFLGAGLLGLALWQGSRRGVAKP
jgi:hypothetical protein